MSSLSRSAWFVALGLALLLFVGAVPVRQARLAALAPETVPPGWTSASWQAALDELGLSPDFYASYTLTFDILLAAGLAIAASVVARRRGHEPVALLVAVGLLMSGLALLPVLAALPPELHGLVRALRAAAWITLIALLLLFPNGRFHPRWTIWLLAAWALYQLASMVVPALSPPLSLRAAATPLQGLVIAWHAGWLVLGLALQYFRLARAGDPTARQQSKWLLLAAAALAIGGTALLLPQWVLPLERAPGLLGVLYTLLSAPLVTLLLLAWPVAVALATLRAGLGDVDFAINRALVYGSLVALLGAGSAAFLYMLERLVPGEPVLTFAVTAVLAGILFRPLRHRLQNAVDRRLYHIRIDYGARPGPDGPALKQGQLGHYTRLQFIGTSEFGQSFRAQSPAHSRPVTLHVLAAAVSAEPGFAERFQHEMEAVTRLEHPNLAQVYAAGEADGRLYVASEYLVGQDLTSFLLINGRLGLARALPILADVARALDALHARGLVHTDVRLAQVMLVLREPDQMQRDARFPARVAFLPTTAFRTVLLHVGLSRALGTGRRGAALAYTAPEQILAGPLDARTDIYSLGALAYQMLAGMLPFSQPSPGALVIAHLRQAPPDPRTRVPSLAPAIAQALMRALAKDPAQRFATAGDFVAALGEPPPPTAEPGSGMSAGAQEGARSDP